MSGEEEEKEKLVLHVRSGGKDERVEKTGTVPSSGPVFRVNLIYQIATHEPKEEPSDPEPEEPLPSALVAMEAPPPESDPERDRYSDRFEVKLELGGKSVLDLDSRIGLHLDVLQGGLLPKVDEDYDLTEAALETGSYSPATVTIAATNVGDARYDTEVLATCTAFPFYELRMGDSDTKEIWGGEKREGEVPCYEVMELQEDLRELGFLLVGNPDGGFGLKTEWAVREFQIYAGMNKVARDSREEPGDTTAFDYISHLAKSDAGHIYDGYLNGRVNERTYLLIQHWKRNKLRCPVVIVAKNTETDQVEKVNLWGKGDHPNSDPRMYAYDVANSFGIDEKRCGVVLGDYWPQGPRREGGTHAVVRITSAIFCVTDGNSTYKVLKAAAEPECGGCLDSVNAWDNSFVSMGPCQWTLGAGNEKGELGAFVAFAGSRGLKPFEPFGVTPYSWGKNLQTDQGTYKTPLGVRMGEDFVPVTDSDDKEMFRNWHWFYRFAMVARTNVEFQWLMWPMTCLRISDILKSPWTEEVSYGSASVTPGTIGNIFTSEKAVACVLRWHIKKPSHIVRDYAASTKVQIDKKKFVDGPLLLAVRAVLKKAVENSKTDSNALERIQDPGLWTDAEEKILIDTLNVEAPGREIPGIDVICAAKEEDLSSSRGSFKLDELNLPAL